MRQIAILGRGPTWRTAPFHDPSVEVWVTSQALMYDVLPRVDRAYEIHHRTLLEHCVEAPDYMDRWRAYNGPAVVYVDPSTLDMPNAAEYPQAGVMAQFGEWFTSSFAWMLAHALYEHTHGQPIDVIHVYGIQLLDNSEYLEQLPCAAYFIGLARGMGIRVEIASAARLCKAARLYGFDSAPTSHAALFRSRRDLPDSAFVDGIRAQMAKTAAWVRDQQVNHRSVCV